MYHIIVNPASRSGKGKKIWEQQINPLLKEKEIEYEVFFSAAPGDVAVLASSILNKYETTAQKPSQIPIIILGGDGTLNESLQGLISSPLLSKVLLGYIPTGSSNDFARDLGISKSPKKALERILDVKNAKPMDIGCVAFENGEKNYFAVSCGIGYDAAVCEEALHSSIKSFFNKIGLGKLTYLGIALKQLIKTKAIPCTVTLDNNQSNEYTGILFIASMLHRYEGGGFMFCPDAKWDDGLLDICLIEKIPKPLVLFALPLAFKGKHYRFRGIHAYKCSNISISTASPLWVHTDGEVKYASKHIDISILKQAVHIIY